MSGTRPQQTGYGASAHYRGAEGEAYFAAQARTGKLGARWNLNLWKEHIHPDDDVLDFGCGGGYLLSVLPGKTKIGIEVNPAAREMAGHLGIAVFETIEEVKERRFSRVISSHALEHVPTPLIALEQLRSRLAPAGQLLFLLPLDDWRTPAHRNYRQDDLHRHLYAWTPQNLGNLLDEAGYQDITIKVIADAMPPNLKLAEILLKSNLLRSTAGRSFSILLRRRQLFARATV